MAQNIGPTKQVAVPGNPMPAKIKTGPIAKASGDMGPLISNPDNKNIQEIHEAHITASGGHRRLNSDQVKPVQGDFSHGAKNPNQIVVINNNNTFEFQMHGAIF